MRTTTYSAARAASMLVLVLLVTSCGADELLGPDAPQGIEGTVSIGPQCPVASADDPCPDLPYEASIEVRVRGGASVTRVRSDADGGFRVGLRPGAYTLRPQSGNPFPVAGEVDVDVAADRYTEVTISYDTGIR